MLPALCKGLTKENSVGSLILGCAKRCVLKKTELNSLNSTSPFLYPRILLAMSSVGLCFSSLVSTSQPFMPGVKDTVF